MFIQIFIFIQIFSTRFITIIGAGSGIGRKVCHILAKQGASVIATDLNLNNAEETIRSLNGLNTKYYFFIIY